MRIRNIRSVTNPLLLLVLALAAQGQDKGPAPALDLKDINGRNLRLADYKGKVVLLNFWATWCPPCRTEIPDLIRWQQQHGRRGGRGMQVIGITYPPQTLSEVRRFSRKAKINYPLALGTEATKSLFTSSDTLPTTVVIDAAGNIRDVIEGIVFPEDFARAVKPLLPKASVPKIQRARIIVDGDGYQPTNIRLTRGVPARLTFIRKAEGCGTEIVIPAYGVNKPLPMNVPVVVSFTPKKSGRFTLTCGMDMFRGSLIVK